MKIIIKRSPVNEGKAKRGDGGFASPSPEFSRYELDDMDTDRQMVELLRQCLEQLKVMAHFITPAKSIGASGAEKFVAQHRVSERIMYHLKEIRRTKSICKN